MHLYSLENFLSFSHRQIKSWPQFGQKNLTAFSPGIIGLLHDVQIGSESSSVNPTNGELSDLIYVFWIYSLALGCL